MPKQNPRDTYKAQLLDYDALLAASDDECSYCLSEREVQIMLAFVDYIGWHTRYIATDTPIDKQTILLWQGNLARKLMSGCCGDDGAIHRFNELGIYQTSTDGGDTWVDDPLNDPRNDGTGAPPLPGSASDGKRCAAADNVRGLFEQYRDNLIEIVGATPTIIAIVAGILAFIGTILGLSGVGIGIGVLFLTMAAEMIQLGGVGISGAITFTALEDFKCLVYCRMNNDGELTYDAWQGLLSDIAGHYSGFAETFFYQTVAGMGYIGMNNAATIGDSTASDCDSCDCGDDCSLKYHAGLTEEPGADHGTIISTDTDQIIMQAGSVGGTGVAYAIIESDALGNCCKIVSVTASEGFSIHNIFYQSCGSTYNPDGWLSGSVGQCVQRLQVQCNETNAEITIVFEQCT